MPDSSAVLTAAHNHLTAAGLIRRPNNAGTPPPAFIEPSGGAPAPGERDGVENDDLLVVSLGSAELAEGPFDSYRRRVVVTFTYRSRSTSGLRRARALDAQIRRRLVEQHDHATGYLMDAGSPVPVQVLQASVYGGLGPVADDDDVRTERASYVLEVLAG